MSIVFWLWVFVVVLFGFFISLSDVEKHFYRMNSIKALGTWLYLMKTNATKDIPYYKHALKHHSKVCFLELDLIQITSVFQLLPS